MKVNQFVGLYPFKEELEDIVSSTILLKFPYLVAAKKIFEQIIPMVTKEKFNVLYNIKYLR